MGKGGGSHSDPFQTSSIVANNIAMANAQEQARMGQQTYGYGQNLFSNYGMPLLSQYMQALNLQGPGGPGTKDRKSVV